MFVNVNSIHLVVNELYLFSTDKLISRNKGSFSKKIEVWDRNRTSL